MTGRAGTAMTVFVMPDSSFVMPDSSFVMPDLIGHLLLPGSFPRNVKYSEFCN